MTVEIMLPSYKEMDRNRKVLEVYFKNGNFESIAKFPNIKFVGKLQKYPAQDFLSYALPFSGNKLILEAAKLHSEYKQVSRPKPGDLVLYFNSNAVLPEVATHIGICLQGDRIISKWGLLNVFDHPLYLVPEGFGEKVRFVERP